MVVRNADGVDSAPAIHGSARHLEFSVASRHAPPQQVGGDRTEPIQTSYLRKTMSLLWSNHGAP